MQPLLLILVTIALLYYRFCEAQVVTVTATVIVPTTLTDTSTQFVLGYCVSLLDAPCREHHQQSNHDAYLYDPSVVEKYDEINYRCTL